MVEMTKLQQWLAAFGVIFAVWFCLVTKKINSSFVEQNFNLIFLSPVIFVVLFGIYAATVVIHRALSIKDCPEAAEELHKEIMEAKEDLIKKGFKFKEKST